MGTPLLLDVTSNVLQSLSAAGELLELAARGMSRPSCASPGQGTDQRQAARLCADNCLVL